MTEQLDVMILGRQYTLKLSAPLTGYWIVFLRVLLGWWFLHAGLNKFATPGEFSAAWFLEKQGTLVSPVLNAFVGGWTEVAVNILIPVSEVLIGLGVLLGCLTRLASFFGAFMMFFFYFGNEAWRRGFVNGDLLGLLFFLTVIVFGAGRVWGLDVYIEQTSPVQSHEWLRYLLG
ncbi:MAG: DoxX family membrane protein [Halorhabdus sp.]